MSPLQSERREFNIPVQRAVDETPDRLGGVNLVEMVNLHLRWREFGVRPCNLLAP
jgi:hypothetical protein